MPRRHHHRNGMTPCKHRRKRPSNIHTMAFIPQCPSSTIRRRPPIAGTNIAFPFEPSFAAPAVPRQLATELHLFGRVATPVIEKGAVRAGRVFGPGSAAVIGLAALTVGLIIGRLTARWSGPQRLSNADEVSRSFSFDEDASPEQLTQWEGTTPVWINDALVRMWSLFQSNTKRLVRDVIQPVLDDSELPDFVTAVRVKSFRAGKQSPQLRAIRRMPSRAVAEVQYSFQTRFSSTSEVEFDVQVSFQNLSFTVPVTMKNLDVDAVVWAAATLAPYEPYCSSVEYALLETPIIGFDMNIAKVIPITAVPILRSYFFKILTESVPKEFMLPKTVVLDFTPDGIKEHKDTIGPATLDLSNLTDEQIKVEFPEQWALFDATDLDGSGALSPVEVWESLRNWGYTAEDAAASFAFVDVNNDKSISFREFCTMWPKLEESFVPSRYKGALSVFIRGAKDLKQPIVGRTDPYVTLQTTTGQPYTSKRDSQSSQNPGNGTAVWRESCELHCLSPSEESLEVVVEEGSRFALHAPKNRKFIGKATVPLASLMTRPSQQLNVELEPQGSVRLDLTYADFVDHAQQQRARTASLSR